MASIDPKGDAQSPARGRSVLLFLLLMFLVSSLNMADRQLIGIAAQPIKREFGLSDTMIGLLGGTAFALVYPPLGLPLAWVADRFNRRNLLAWCLAWWSAATMLCGVVTAPLGLLLSRIGVAAGEAGYAPTSHSLIADTIAPERRSSAFAVLVAGISAGTFIAMVGGGWLTQHYGWRTAFIAIGAPGVLVAILVRLLVREPARTTMPGGSPWPAYKRLLGSAPFRWCVAGSALHLMVTYGLIWAVPWLERSHGIGPAQAGLLLGTIGAAAGLIGSLAGGAIGDRLAQSDRRWLGWWPAVTVLAAAAFGVPALLTQSLTLALLGLAAATFLNALYQPSTYALVQGVAGPGERASAAALMIFIQNLIGLGLGPACVGFASDLLTPEFGADALGIALAGLFLVNGLSAAAFYCAGRALGPGKMGE